MATIAAVAALNEDTLDALRHARAILVTARHLIVGTAAGLIWLSRNPEDPVLDLPTCLKHCPAGVILGTTLPIQRNLQALRPTISQNVAEWLAHLLNEPAFDDTRQIQAIIARHGLDYVLEMADRALRIHHHSPPQIASRRRMRTLGGVFFQTVRDDKGDERPKTRRLSWIDCQKDATARTASGKMKMISTLTGILTTPAQKVAHTRLWAIKMRCEPKSSPAPDMPSPDAPPDCTVYLTTRQWRRLEPSLKTQSPVKIEGTVYPTGQDLVLIATNIVTTPARSTPAHLD